MREEAGFHMFFEKVRTSRQKLEVNDPKLPKKRKVPSCYEHGEAPAEFVSTVEEHYRQIFYQTIDMVTNCICDRFQQKDYVETFQTMENLLLKALLEEDFGLEFQQIFSFFVCDLDKFKLETQLTTLTHIIDEKEVEIKDAIKVISSLNPSQKMLVSEVLKLVKLILLVPAANAVSEKSCSSLRRDKTYLQSSMTQERLNSGLVLAIYKEQVDKLNLVEVANQFCFNNEHLFSIFGKFKNKDFPRKFTESATVGTQTSNQSCRSVETQMHPQSRRTNLSCPLFHLSRFYISKELIFIR